MLKEFQLNGKVALVTGAGRGIGAECARVMAEAGARVMLTDVDLNACTQVQTALLNQGIECCVMQQDVTDEARWQEVVNETIEQLGGLDILINNAGILDGSLVELDSLEQVTRLNKVNIESVFLGMKYAALAMKPDGAAGKGGSIINLSSVAALAGTIAHSAYGATKGAVASYSRHAAAEFGSLGYGIRVNSIHPGVIETPMGDHVKHTWVNLGIMPDEESADAMVKSMTSLGRNGTPRDIALAALYLASDASAFVTGIQLSVDGGMANR
ncbi:SDR family oxidoreductase [Spongiibacter sp. KMU-158]|uniref:SDR family oxidoreductase n=1 Tax=Spongiibacter pelagi TaxID=2760804 RepID=A0A927C3F7_9GAMM|nr:SDR family oxidoreductase [Spongiibacter pelagi]MBD2859448.1 SDR family oxidoreductase [Spongiibacter pelagi]